MGLVTVVRTATRVLLVALYGLISTLQLKKGDLDPHSDVAKTSLETNSQKTSPLQTSYSNLIERGVLARNFASEQASGGGGGDTYLHTYLSHLFGTTVPPMRGNGSTVKTQECRAPSFATKENSQICLSGQHAERQIEIARLLKCPERDKRERERERETGSPPKNNIWHWQWQPIRRDHPAPN